MSTAGKVLVGIVTFMLLVWLVLFSMVARLNSNWGEELSKQESQVATLKEEAPKVDDRLARLKNDISREQVFTDRDALALRAEVADRQKLLTHAIESAERVKQQVIDHQQAEKTTQSVLERRRQEKADTIQALADARKEVEDLMAANDSLMAQLAQLQDDFKATLAENRQLVRGGTR